MHDMAPHHGWNGRDGQHGVTLIEQVMTVTLVAVLACVAMPSLSQLLHRNEIGAAQTEFIGALQYTRALAAQSGIHTVFCPSVDGTHCSKQVRWDHGWLVRRDQKNLPDAAPTRVGQPRRKVTIISTAGRQQVRYQADGSAGGNNITLTFCLRGRSEQALSLFVSGPGRVRGAPADAAHARACASAN